jgi:hypothetical protein
MCTSFTYNYTSIAELLTTKAEIESANGGGVKLEIKVLWDTGSNISVLDKETVRKLNLHSVSNGFIDSLTEKGVPSNLYTVNLYLPGKMEISNLSVSEGELTGCDMLIGMDIISTGDLAISNYKGKTTFIFRKPSMGRFSYEPAKSDKTGRNDLCPCGSGRKFKHCCYGK